MPKSAASSPSACTPGVHPFPRRTTKAASGEHFASRPPDLHHYTARAAASARRTLSQAGRGLGGVIFALFHSARPGTNGRGS